MTIDKSHAFLLKEMHRLHVHLMDKLMTQLECIKTISIDLLAFKMDMERDFSSFHDLFQSIKANVQEIPCPTDVKGS